VSHAIPLFFVGPAIRSFIADIDVAIAGVNIDRSNVLLCNDLLSCRPIHQHNL